MVKKKKGNFDSTFPEHERGFFDRLFGRKHGDENFRGADYGSGREKITLEPVESIPLTPEALQKKRQREILDKLVRFEPDVSKRPVPNSDPVFPDRNFRNSPSYFPVHHYIDQRIGLGASYLDTQLAYFKANPAMPVGFGMAVGALGRNAFRAYKGLGASTSIWMLKISGMTLAMGSIAWEFWYYPRKYELEHGHPWHWGDHESMRENGVRWENSPDNPNYFSNVGKSEFLEE
eukprot:920112_1